MPQILNLNEFLHRTPSSGGAGVGIVNGGIARSNSASITPSRRRVYMMGICGTAMASLAGLLKSQGFEVRGSDSAPYPPMSDQLERLGISYHRGYAADNLLNGWRPEWVIVGNVMSRSNVEVQEMLKLDLPYISQAQAMGELLLQDHTTLVVAGTHGKTTTTSMLAWTLECLGQKPGFFIGGIPKNFGQSFANPQGVYFAIEGDEYDTAFFDKVPKFKHYFPSHAILTSIEFDHADIYKDLDAVKDAFRILLRSLGGSKALFYSGADSNIHGLVAETPNLLAFSYGWAEEGEPADKFVYTARRVTSNFAQGKESTSADFETYFRGTALGRFSLPMSGIYNILNATAVIGLCHHLGFSPVEVGQALRSFLGVKRRQEILGEPGGVLVIEDFAHHPTAVRVTLEGLRMRYPGRLIHAAFEPRSATSRRRVFQKAYEEAFASADRAYIMEAYDVTKIEDPFSSTELVAGLRDRGQRATLCKTVDELVEDIRREVRSGDVVVLMSNGGFGGVYGKILERLNKT